MQLILLLYVFYKLLLLSSLYNFRNYLFKLTNKKAPKFYTQMNSENKERSQLAGTFELKHQKCKI